MKLTCTLMTIALISSPLEAQIVGQTCGPGGCNPVFAPPLQPPESIPQELAWADGLTLAELKSTVETQGVWRDDFGFGDGRGTAALRTGRCTITFYLRVSVGSDVSRVNTADAVSADGSTFLQGPDASICMNSVAHR